MKKKFVAVALVLAMTAGLAACGKTKVKLCEYKGIALQDVTEEDIQSKIDNYVSTYLYENEEVDGPVESGDLTYINFVGTKDGVAFDGGTDKSEEGYPLTIGSGSFIPGFEDGIIGMNKGDVKVLDLTFPEDYGNADLAGAAVKFEVTLKKISRRFDLELNDENVKKYLNYDTVESFKQAVSDDLKYQSYTEQLGDYLSENCTATNLPKDEIQKYSDEVYNYTVNNVKQYALQYSTSEEMILNYLLGMESYEALRQYCDDGAKQNVAYQYIIKEIAKKEGIVASEADITERGGKYAKQYGFESVEELIEQATKEVVKDAIEMDMTLEFLIDNAKIF